MAAAHGFEMSPPTAQIFGNAAREHMERYGTTEAQLAAVGAKNHRHSANNPNAQFQDVYSVDEILAAKDDPPAADQAPVLAHLGRRGRGRRRLRALRRASTGCTTRPWRSSPRR